MTTSPALSTVFNLAACSLRSPLSFAALALALGACATSSSSTSSSTPATTPVAAAPAPATPAPVVSTPPPVTVAATPAPTVVAASIDFDKQVKPFFAEYCIRCHGGARPSGRLDFTSAPGLTRGIGNADNSRIYTALTASGDGHMPPMGRPQPTADEIAMIKQWIDQGPTVPADYSATQPAGGAPAPRGDD